MEFGEKLRSLRKSKHLTQEELAASLFVTRTAVSKWESGRGYPSMDSIKEIATFFSVTIDELLSGEKILSLAEKENKQSMGKMCDLLFGIADLFALMLIVLPLYPNDVQGHIYSVSLLDYRGISSFNRTAYWIVFLAFVILGVLKTALTQCNLQKGQKATTWISMGLGVVTVLLLIVTRQVYATLVVFALLIIKGILYLKHPQYHRKAVDSGTIILP